MLYISNKCNHLLITIFVSFIGLDNEDIEAGEQTVYACGGSSLVLRCGENVTHPKDKVKI